MVFELLKWYQILVRDGGRCCVTKKMDSSYYAKLVRHGVNIDPRKIRTTGCQNVHIVPVSSSYGSEDGNFVSLLRGPTKY